MEQEDGKVLEKRELDNLIERGVTFSVPVRSVLRFFGKSRERAFIIRQPYLGTLDYLSTGFINLQFSEADFEANPLNESKLLVHRNARECARIVAIAVLNSKWGIKLFTPLLANYFLWRITPEKLLQLTLIIYQIGNLADFINAIRYLSVTRTTTSPNLIAEAGEVQE